MTDLLFRDDAYARSCTARVVAADQRGIRLDRTVFYPTGGGQPGDTGSLRLASGETIAIVDAVKGDAADEVVHVPAPGMPLPSPGTEPTAGADEELETRPELVRTMSVKPPSGAGRVRLMEVAGIDLQPCGGTHIRNTAEIGPIKINKIENKGRQNRRINVQFVE